MFLQDIISAEELFTNEISAGLVLCFYHPEISNDMFETHQSACVAFTVSRDIVIVSLGASVAYILASQDFGGQGSQSEYGGKELHDDGKRWMNRFEMIRADVH